MWIAKPIMLFLALLKDKRDMSSLAYVIQNCTADNNSEIFMFNINIQDFMPITNKLLVQYI